MLCLRENKIQLTSGGQITCIQASSGRTGPYSVACSCRNSSTSISTITIALCVRQANTLRLHVNVKNHFFFLMNT